MNLYESIKKNLTETDSRYYVLRKLQDAFDSLSEIDYGDIEGTDRYGNMKPGLEDQERINKLITDIVQDNNITKEEFDDVAKPYKDGFDISFSYYDYVPKHGKIEEADKGLYVYSNAQSQDGRSDAESYIHNYKAEAPNLDFKVHEDGGMWYVDFIGSKEDIISYLKKLGWYTDKEIEEYGLVKPLNEADDAYMKEWRSICEAFCKKIGAELLFVNSDNFGYTDKNGNNVHMYADELEQFIKNGGLKESDKRGLTCFACDRPTTDRDDNNKPVCSECYSLISDLVAHGEWIEEEYNEKATYDDFKNFDIDWRKYFKTSDFKDIPLDALIDEAYEIYMRMPH